MTDDLRDFLVALLLVLCAVACGIGGALIGGWQ